MHYSAYISVAKVHFSAHITKLFPHFSVPGYYSLTKCGKQWVIEIGTLIHSFRSMNNPASSFFCNI